MGNCLNCCLKDSDLQQYRDGRQTSFQQKYLSESQQNIYSVNNSQSCDSFTFANTNHHSNLIYSNNNIVGPHITSSNIPSSNNTNVSYISSSGSVYNPYLHNNNNQGKQQQQQQQQSFYNPASYVNGNVPTIYYNQPNNQPFQFNAQSNLYNKNNAMSHYNNAMFASMETTGSLGNLQHISEREPDDIHTDPSLNPNMTTMFLSRSHHEVEMNLKKRRTFYEKNLSRKQVFHRRRINSTSTINLDDSTVSRPNLKTTVRALATAIYYQIKNRDKTKTQQNHMDSPEIFDESLHPINRDIVPGNYEFIDPDFRTIYRFIRNLFQSAQLSPECTIVTMVYLERLLSNAEVDLYPGNWKRILLCAILLASKVWDDQAVWNVDYCQIFRDLKVDDVNELERNFLEIIQFNINVPSSVYVKYYFDIRALSDCSQPILLSRERAIKLEAIKRLVDDPFRDAVNQMETCQRSRRHGNSLNKLTTIPKFKCAILP